MGHFFTQLMEHFELILALLVLICLIFYCFDHRYGYAKQRKILYRAFAEGKENQAQREIYALRLAAVLTHQKPEDLPAHFHQAQNKLTHQERLSGRELHWLQKPVFPNEKVVDFFSGSFWILFIIFMLRSFVIEPFKIPSGSMEPTLYAGDFIVSDKFSYGIRLPMINQKIIPTGQVKRGDVIVFNYPLQPKTKYIKRVIGIPGDKINIINGRIILNGVPQEIKELGTLGKKGEVLAEEALQGQTHLLQFYPQMRLLGNIQFTVPEGKYFVMGDNRDGSSDSRVWGYVDDKHLIGKARFIWLNSDCLFLKGRCNRIGTKII